MLSLFSMLVDCMRTLSVKGLWVRLQWGSLCTQISRWFWEKSEFTLYWTRSSIICITDWLLHFTDWEFCFMSVDSAFM